MRPTTEKDRMKEWLNRSADVVYSLRKKPRLGKDKRLEAIRQNYNIISVLIKIAEGSARIQGIAPLKQDE